MGYVKVPGSEPGQEGPEVHEMELEDHVRVELPAGSHITLGYFDEGFRDLYAQYVLVMLRERLHRLRASVWRCAAISGSTHW